MAVLAADGGTAATWLRFAAVAATRALLGVTAALLLWATAPLALGWQPVVVTSGSMAPAVAVGDVVVAAPVDPADLRPGHVVVVDDPAHPGGLLTHRVQQVGPDGTITTKGDANPTSDTSPVTADAVHGLARLRIPFVGLPLAWATRGDTALLVAVAAVAAVAVAVAAREPVRRPLASPAAPAPARVRRHRRGVLARARRLTVRARARGPASALVVLAAVCATSAALAEPARAAFSATTTAAGSWAAAPDWVAPTTSAAVVSAMSGTRPHHATGFVRQGGGFRVYANAADTGNPASGVASVTAGLVNLTGSGTPASLAAGSVTVGGTAYGYGSASTLTAAATLSEGAKTFTITSTDGAGNAGATQWNATVDNTAPSATDVQALNKTGGTVGLPEVGDQVVLTYSEPVEPVSTFPTAQSPTFTGTPAQLSVTVRITRSGNGGGAINTLAVFDAADTTELTPLGSVRLGSNSYNTNGSTPLSFTGSTMAVGAGSPATVVLTLGTPSASPGTVNSAVTMQWTVVAGVTDRAGNAVPAATVNESGAADPDF